MSWLKNEIVSFDRRRAFIPGAAVAACLISAFAVFAQNTALVNKFSSADFPLVYKNKPAEIIVAEEDFKVAKIAAEAFAADVESVANRKPALKTSVGASSKNLVIIGTLGKSTLLEKLVAGGKIDVSGIAGKRESFLIETIENPFPGAEKALVVAGSDRRGTAFGAFELSQRIGVSPWVWWADVAPENRRNLIISSGRIVSREPSVKYRGIFLNDEDWGLQPWAARTFEPETGNIGPKTYAKIFELLLRLKANTCWAAMHEVTKPFSLIEGQKTMSQEKPLDRNSPKAKNPAEELKAKNDRIKNAGIISIEAEHFARRHEKSGFERTTIEGLGKTAIRSPFSRRKRARLPIWRAIRRFSNTISRFRRPAITSPIFISSRRSPLCRETV